MSQKSEFETAAIEDGGKGKRFVFPGKLNAEIFNANPPIIIRVNLKGEEFTASNALQQYHIPALIELVGRYGWEYKGFVIGENPIYIFQRELK